MWGCDLRVRASPFIGAHKFQPLCDFVLPFFFSLGKISLIRSQTCPAAAACVAALWITKPSPTRAQPQRVSMSQVGPWGSSFIFSPGPQVPAVVTCYVFCFLYSLFSWRIGPGCRGNQKPDLSSCGRLCGCTLDCKAMAFLCLTPADFLCLRWDITVRACLCLWLALECFRARFNR